MEIKICGLKRVKDTEIINEYSSDINYIGLVFAKSKRKVDKYMAKEIIKNLDSKIKTVGVFVDTTAEEINSIVEFSGLDIVQMHGSESIKECEKINVPVWKAFKVKEEKDLDLIKDYKNLDGILLDGKDPGSGGSFNWHWAKYLSKEYKIILAGGLNSENVQRGIEIIKPFTVDVSSGVELDGFKNKEKIREFIRKVKEYETR
ncbi:phosphoribosylanthranilate isomerase [Clostridium sediminicola]|uniref:phosphoribosylanthranilate isomerase n=1 Tax=Clostridium sediminicola TaxID=3114879 RepID=UPI0031F22A16